MRVPPLLFTAPYPFNWHSADGWVAEPRLSVLSDAYNNNFNNGNLGLWANAKPFPPKPSFHNLFVVFCYCNRKGVRIGLLASIWLPYEWRPWRKIYLSPQWPLTVDKSLRRGGTSIAESRGAQSHEGNHSFWEFKSANNGRVSPHSLHFTSIPTFTGLEHYFCPDLCDGSWDLFVWVCTTEGGEWWYRSVVLNLPNVAIL